MATITVDYWLTMVVLITGYDGNHSYIAIGYNQLY